MKWWVLFCAFTVAGFSENVYQKHLPKVIYQLLSEQALIDTSLPENTTERPNGDMLRVSIELLEEKSRQADVVDYLRDKLRGGEGRQVVVVDYWCGEAVDDFRGIQVGYRKGRLLGFAVFDGAGRDYVASPPFSDEEENETIFNLHALIQGGYQQLKEVCRTL